MIRHDNKGKSLSKEQFKIFNGFLKIMLDFGIQSITLGDDLKVAIKYEDGEQHIYLKKLNKNK